LHLVDYHVHTKRCGHAKGEDRRYIEAAIGKGLKEIGFSDHIPKFYEADQGKKITSRGMSPASLDDYANSIIRLKTAYPEITVKLGLEIDVVPGWEEAITELIAPYPWDYLTGAVHFIPEWDYHYIGYDTEHTPAEIYQAYFNQVAVAAGSKLFDILGHIDLPRRFFPRLDEGMMNDLYQILAIRLGKANATVELNTYGVRSSKQGDVGVFPDEPLLRMLRHHGVNVTLGSDAHSPGEVGADFDRAVERLKTVGYDRITSFTRRKASLVKWQGT
jgi:histidinol-phosphatase (PHP family)